MPTARELHSTSRSEVDMRFVSLMFVVAMLALPVHSEAAPCKKNPDCQDGNPCTTDRCDHATKTCRYTPVTDGTSCNDQNACTQTDTCQSGSCVGANPITCTASDQCHAAGSCDPGTGVCSNPAVTDGTSCTDYDACTQTDSCQAGQCVGGNPVACTAIDGCHLAGTCEPTTGFCSNPPKDVSVCAAIGQCDLPGTCDVATSACTTSTKQDGTACNDGDACTQTDACSAGACVGGNPVTCGASGSCSLQGSCDSLTGLCNGSPAPDGTACDAGTAVTCSVGDTCQSGVCTPGGGGDQDGDGICDADDDCPSTPDAAQADLDGDGMGDACDGADASISLSRVAFHVSVPATASNGHVIFKGSLTADALGTAQGLGVHVGDAGTLAVDETFDATECRTVHAGFKCKKSADASTQAKFRGKAGSFRFTVRLGRRAIDAVPVAPVGVTLTTDGMIDRVGAAASCKTSAVGARCIP
jgi:hypothetical protein